MLPRETFYVLIISEIPSKAIPATTNATLRYYFLVNRSFKNIRANIMVTKQ